MSIWKALENAVLDDFTPQKIIVNNTIQITEEDLFLLRNDNYAADEYMQNIILETTLEVHNTKDYEPYVIGLFAVGMAVARCDGRIAEEEKREIKDFIDFVSKSELPCRFYDKIDAIKNMIFLNFNTAMSFVGQMNPKTWFVVDHLITLTIKADGRIAPQEIEFYKNWKEWLNKNEIN